ncbi:MAG: ABC transporter ATP-binding protein [Ethanoligenens sp.]|uniref:ABC transporter ATP-binding protein n=1 Tax=Ethanoligenens sp. TaxID=2099655 RepID=UPI0039E794F7
METNVMDLVVSGVTKDFEIHGKTVNALREINLTVKHHEFVSILGTSGCGKSTLLRIIGGLEKPSAGKVLIEGREIKGPGADRGMVFQAYTLFPWLTVSQNIEFGLKERGVAVAERRKITEKYVEVVGLKGFENVFPKALSGGMKQRVALARALANDPEVLLLDEPFGALDMQTRGLMQELLLNVWQKSPKTIIMVTHDIDEAIFLADRVIVMTAHPGAVKEIIEVKMPRPRDYMIRTSPEFMAYKKQAMQLIHDESIKAAQR